MRAGDENRLLQRSWFFKGNAPKVDSAQYVINGHQIRTIAAPSEDPEEPNCWAVEMIHPDSGERARRWSAEATFRKNEDGTIRFTTLIKHWMIPFYIGEYPEPPSPSAPNYVGALLDDKVLTCTKGDAILQSRPIKVINPNARTVFDALVSDERQLPFVLVAHHPQGGMLVDPGRVAKALVGNANVFVLSAPSVVEEMNYYLGTAFSCEPGSIRVYLPQLDRSRPSSARFHRFLSTVFIQQYGEDSIIRFLTNGLSRNGATFRLSDLTSFMDIFSERRKHAIKKLAADSKDKSQEARMVWEENERLSEKADEWESFAIQFESDNKRFECEIERLRDEIGSLKYRIEEAERVRRRIEDLESQIAGVSLLTSLPTNLAEVLESLTRLFPRRIEFTEDARKSALEYSKEHGGYWSKTEQLATGWEMLFDVANNLYELVFRRQSVQLDEEFNALSKFELALSEGSQTKKDARLMKLRQVFHRGKTFDITPHIKYGNKKPKLLRLYFAIDRESERLVIGQFGDHIENYTTSKIQ